MKIFPLQNILKNKYQTFDKPQGIYGKLNHIDILRKISFSGGFDTFLFWHHVAASSVSFSTTIIFLFWKWIDRLVVLDNKRFCTIAPLCIHKSSCNLAYFSWQKLLLMLHLKMWLRADHSGIWPPEGIWCICKVSH